MTIQLTEQKLKMLIKQSVQEGLSTELMKLRAMLLPFVSDEEQEDIEKLYGEPSREKAPKRHKVRSMS